MVKKQSTDAVRAGRFACGPIGLAVYIAKRLLYQKLAGAVWEIGFILPARSRNGCRVAGVSLLLIDDDPVFCRFVHRELGLRGCDVRLAASMAEGLARVQDGAFDAVVLDYGTATRTGTLGAILSLPHGPSVIALTGPGQATGTIMASMAGAIRYVVRDFGPDFIDALDHAVRSAWSHARGRRETSAAHDAMRQARDGFEALAAERQLLLHEVNHRVGNSLQMVGAFLHMQASSSTNPETRQALGEANRRVLAVAQVHRQLHATDDVRSVPLGQYLRTLVDDIRDSAGREGLGARLSVSADEVETDPDSALTIGIVVTELVINAMKHAYPMADGPIRVMVRAGTEPGLFRLLVEDDGVGRSQETGSPTGIGDTIIRAMASKLSTAVEYDVAASGTRAGMTFKVQRAAG